MICDTPNNIDAPAVKDSLTTEDVRALFNYDRATGELRWRYRADASKTWNTKYAGKLAGYINKIGYRCICINNGRYLAHRLIWILVTGRWPQKLIDHINGDRADNRWSNLREATFSENGFNAPPRKNNSTGITGVSWYSNLNCYVAKIYINRKSKHLGCYDSLEEAAEARRRAERKLHGKFAYRKQR